MTSAAYWRACDREKCDGMRASPLTPGARLSGGRPVAVKGAPSGRVAYGDGASATLEQQPTARPPDPMAPVGLRGGAGEALRAYLEGGTGATRA
jgi:hypothetical protein